MNLSLLLFPRSAVAVVMSPVVITPLFVMSLVVAFLPDTSGADSVWVTNYQIDSVLLGVSCSSNKILVLIDNYYESWHAFVDGNPAPVLRSYGSFRAVEIPAGTKEVRFEYKSQKYFVGKLATGLTSLYLLVILGLNVYVGRRKNTGERNT